MRINKFIITLGVLTILTLCSGAYSQKIKYNYMRDTDFSKYQTYKWVRVEKAQYPNQLLDEQIMQSIDRQLAQKGLRKIDTGTPDLAMVYQVALRGEQQWNSYSTGGYGWG